MRVGEGAAAIGLRDRGVGRLDGLGAPAALVVLRPIQRRARRLERRGGGGHVGLIVTDAARTRTALRRSRRGRRWRRARWASRGSWAFSQEKVSRDERTADPPAASPLGCVRPSKLASQRGRSPVARAIRRREREWSRSPLEGVSMPDGRRRGPSTWTTVAERGVDRGRRPVLARAR